MDLEIVKENRSLDVLGSGEMLHEFLTMKINNQVFGIPVTNIRDVLVLQELANVPLAPSEVVGMINLRGRIVTALDIRAILKISDKFNPDHSMNVVVEYQGELYSLIVDTIGDVIRFPLSKLAQNPENLSKNWQEVSLGIFPVEEELIVIVDINKLLQNLNADEKI